QQVRSALAALHPRPRAFVEGRSRRLRGPPGILRSAARDAGERLAGRGVDRLERLARGGVGRSGADHELVDLGHMGGLLRAGSIEMVAPGLSERLRAAPGRYVRPPPR